jgi:hypothetical protein
MKKRRTQADWAFKKSGGSSYAYKEGRATAFIGRTSYTSTGLVANANAWVAADCGIEQDSSPTSSHRQNLPDTAFGLAQIS